MLKKQTSTPPLFVLPARQRGFTIVEMLIVIVVIGILAAIITVTFNGVQNRAQDAATTSHVDSLVKQVKAAQIINDDITPGIEKITQHPQLTTGTVLYTYTGATLDSTPNKTVFISDPTFKSTYNTQLGGRTAYIAFSVPTFHNNRYYLGAMAVGLFRNPKSVSVENKPLLVTDSPLRVTGWSIQTNASFLAKNNHTLTCTNGRTPTATPSTWGAATKQLEIQVPLIDVFNKKERVILGAKVLSIRKATVNCSGTGGGTSDVYSLVDATLTPDSKLGYPGIFPVHMSEEALTQ